MKENEKRVRDFYEATIPGHRERVTSLQSAHVVYELPEGMPTGGGRFEGVAVREDFLPEFYGALDARFVTEEFITGGRTGRRDRASRG
jgi:ketosteroid isomerase-like protein